MAAFFARVKQRPDAVEAGDPKKKDGAEYVYVDRDGRSDPAAHRARR